MQRLFFTLLLLFAFNAVHLSAKTQPPFQPDRSATVFSLMNESGFSEVKLYSDFNRFRAEKKKEIRLNAKIELRNQAGKMVEIDLEIEPRGHFRRRTCSFPPIKLIFQKDNLEKQGFSRYARKLKLVTHCQDHYESDQRVLREYWAYKMFNQVTPYSFQVQLVNITYVDTTDGSEEEHLAFIIESNKELEKRLGGEMEDRWGMASEDVEESSYYHALLFNYMIGNADWNIEKNQNIKFLYPDAGGKPWLIPYDFDFAGLVDAPYAIPKEDLRQTNVRQRIVMGSFTNSDELHKTADHFRNTFLGRKWCFSESPHLNSSSKAEMENYLDAFVRILQNDKKLEKLFIVN